VNPGLGIQPSEIEQPTVCATPMMRIPCCLS